jgi:HSP20 family molecular chaperone IbpA
MYRINHPTYRVFDQFLEQLLDANSDACGQPRRAPQATYAVTTQTTDNGYQVVAQLPGVPRERIQLAVDNNRLHLSVLAKAPEAPEASDHPEDNEPTNCNTAGCAEAAAKPEPTQGTAQTVFERQFRLPQDVDAQATQATYADGLLTIDLPRQQAPQARQITIC